MIQLSAVRHEVMLWRLKTLKTVRFHKIGPSEVLQLDELPLPQPGKGEIRLRVTASTDRCGTSGVIHTLCARKRARSEKECTMSNSHPSKRLLIKSGTILSIDPAVGDLASGDVLIEGTRITAVGPSLAARNAEIVDATNMIVLPGFVDAHGKEH